MKRKPTPIKTAGRSAAVGLSSQSVAEIGAMFFRAIELHRLGKFDEARILYEKVRVVFPEEISLLTNLGTLHLDCGDYAESLRILERSLAIDSTQPKAWNNLGNVHRQLGAREQALECYDRAIALAADFADAHNNKGVVLYELDRHEDALAEFAEAIRLRPDDASAHYNRASALFELGRCDQALEGYDRAITLGPEYAEAHNGRGLALDALGRNAEAMESYLRAVACRPDYAEAYNNLGVACSELGRLDDARAAFQAALSIRPDYAEVHHNLSAIKTYSADDPQLAVLENMAARAGSMPVRDRVHLFFALGKAREDVADFDAAFAAYAEANRLQFELTPYDEAAAEAMYAELVRTFGHDRFSYPPADLSASGKVPVFIVGMPRSGTTLIEQILSSSPGVFGVGEVDIFGGLVRRMVGAEPGLGVADWARDATPEQLAALGNAYLDQLWRLAPAARFIVDKTLDNFWLLGPIRLALPNARIIHAMRDPMDSCFSSYAKLFTGNLQFTYDLGTLGRHYVRYMKLMRHWQNVLPAGSLLDLRYEDMVADSEGQARRLLAFLGLPWNPGCLEFHKKERPVRTASLAQVRKPIYATSVARWRNFAPHLKPLLDIVADYRKG